MARTKTRRRKVAATFATDEQLIAHLQDEAPELLRTRVSDDEFETTVGRLLKESPSAQIQHFYCRPCGEYHLKTHRHYREMRKRQTQAKAGK
jgi:hypothetical protein